MGNINTPMYWFICMFMSASCEFYMVFVEKKGIIFINLLQYGVLENKANSKCAKNDHLSFPYRKKNLVRKTCNSLSCAENC